MDAILKLRAVGYRVEIDGDRIRYRLPAETPEPDPATLAPILAELKARKEEAVAFLQAEARPTMDALLHGGTDQPDQPDRPPLFPFDPLPAYPFAIRSGVLHGAEVWIIPDGWPEPVEGPAYSHAEVAALARQKATPEALRAVHLVKLAIDGEVLE